jgi:hypothetical protein
MAQQTAIMRHLDTAQHEPAPAAKAMCVKPVAYAKIFKHRPPERHIHLIESNNQRSR